MYPKFDAMDSEITQRVSWEPYRRRSLSYLTSSWVVGVYEKTTYLDIPLRYRRLAPGNSNTQPRHLLVSVRERVNPSAVSNRVLCSLAVLDNNYPLPLV